VFIGVFGGFQGGKRVNNSKIQVKSLGGMELFTEILKRMKEEDDNYFKKTGKLRILGGLAKFED
jgi:hypothetical protein|tara:strand:- start:291 stop:482 length:192 start_codon:yes stop_codon:yes gene_type:complete